MFRGLKIRGLGDEKLRGFRGLEIKGFGALGN